MLSPSLIRSSFGCALLLTFSIASALVTTPATATESVATSVETRSVETSTVETPAETTTGPDNSARGTDASQTADPAKAEESTSPSSSPPHGPAMDTERAEDQTTDFKPSSQRPAPSFSTLSQEIVRLDNGLLLQGDEVHTPDGYTSGFRLTAGFSPVPSDGLDLGAELRYRESNNVPTSVGGNHVQDVTSFGGSLIAGLRVGDFGLYGKTGYAQWSSDPVTGSQQIETSSGMARIQGFGARWLADDGWIGQLEMEEIDHPLLEHLNMVTASVHLPF